jgi:cell division transport system permease protein
MRVSYLIAQVPYLTKKGIKTGLILLLCIASAFLALGVFTLITLNLKAAAQKLKGEEQIEVYLDDQITPAEFHSLLQRMKGLPGVEKVKYKSRREALAQMESFLGEDLLQEPDSIPLPASFLVALGREHRRVEEVTRVAARIEGESGVDDVAFGGTSLMKLDRTISTFLVVDLVLGVCMALVVVVLVASLAGAVAREKAKSIRIMRLLGASGADISLPLLMQGILLGGLGALLGALLLRIGHLAFTSRFSPAEFLPAHLLVAMILWGMILGAAGSFVQARRILRLCR